MLRVATALALEARLLAERSPLPHDWAHNPFWSRKIQRWGDKPTRRAYEFKRKGGCIFWMGGRNQRGHGIDGSTSAHRNAYEVFFGLIPTGRQVHHLCGTPPCCRPDHLLAVTDAEHLQITRGRHPGNTEGVDSVARARRIVQLVGEGARHVDVVKETGISLGFVSHVWSGLAYGAETLDLRERYYATIDSVREARRLRTKRTATKRPGSSV